MTNRKLLASPSDYGLLCSLDAEFPDGYQAICNQCEATFTSKGSLLAHVEIVHNKKYESGYNLFLCDECYYVSHNNYKGFRHHKKCHKLSHVYRCNGCWFLSGTLGGIRRHLNKSLPCSIEDVVEIRDGVSSPPSPGELKSVQCGKERTASMLRRSMRLFALKFILMQQRLFSLLFMTI